MIDDAYFSALSSHLFLVGCGTILVVLLVGVLLNALFLHFAARLVGVESNARKAFHATLLTWLFGAFAALFAGAVLAGSSWQLALTVNLLTSIAAGAAAILIAYGVPFVRALLTYLVASLLMAIALTLAAAIGLAVWGPEGGLSGLRTKLERAVQVLKVGGPERLPSRHVAVPLSQADGLVGAVVEIDLSNGETARGTLLGVESDVLVVRERLEGGTVELRLRKENIVTLYRLERIRP